MLDFGTRRFEKVESNKILPRLLEVLAVNDNPVAGVFFMADFHTEFDFGSLAQIPF